MLGAGPHANIRATFSFEEDADETLFEKTGRRWGYRGVDGIFLVSLINLSSPGYGVDFLHMTSSIYPWFHDAHTLANVFVGTIDGLVDGSITALIFAALYNACAERPAETKSQVQRPGQP